MTKVIVFCPYPKGIGPSQRFRVEMFIDQYEGDIQFDLCAFWSEKAYRILYSEGRIISKLIHLFFGYLRRIFHVFKARKYDFVFIHREAAPLGPPVFEWLLKFVFGKKIIFDFDDAIWLNNTSESNRIAAGFKWHSKFYSICSWSYKISAGNEFLAAKAREFNSNVEIIPTVVDTESHYNPSGYNKSNHLVTIGWTGSHSTIEFISEFLPILREIYEEITFRLIIISNENPHFDFPDFHFIKWNKESEVQDLLQMDIGIMPLPDNDWSRGKCGFKIIQYQAMEIPAVASNIPPNDKIISHGDSGFVCSSEKEWKTSILTLLKNGDLRKEFGKKGRDKIIREYSHLSQKSHFFRLFV